VLLTCKYNQLLNNNKKNFVIGRYLALLCVFLSLLSGCASPPTKIENICNIFQQEPSWFDETRDVHEKWGVPIHVQMAILRQESAFKDDARPPRKKLFGLIPTFRPSSAYGFAQALDQTWEWYMKSTGNSGADRDDFADAVDFIGWYVNISNKRLKISKWDAKLQYLAYHEGHGGYEKKSWRAKKWLLPVAKKVERAAKTYRKQLPACREKLENRWHFWLFD
jgi:hypothetical protein